MKLEYRKLTVADSDNREIYSFLKENLDYFILCDGESPTKCTLGRILKSIPKGYTLEDKENLVAIADGKIVGLIDILKGYGTSDSWTIGLLLVAPRGCGIGQNIHKEIIKQASKDGVNTLRIGVIKENIMAYEFWKKIGYKQIKNVETKVGKQVKDVEVMTLNIKNI